jgi:hypothetical protein
MTTIAAGAGIVAVTLGLGFVRLARWRRRNRIRRWVR